MSDNEIVPSKAQDDLHAALLRVEEAVADLNAFVRLQSAIAEEGRDGKSEESI